MTEFEDYLLAASDKELRKRQIVIRGRRRVIRERTVRIEADIAEFDDLIARLDKLLDFSC